MDIEKIVRLDMNLLDDNSQKRGCDLTYYLSASDSFQNLQSIIQNGYADMNLAVVTDALNMCKSRMDLIIEEESQDTPYWEMIVLLKQQVLNISTLIELTTRQQLDEQYEIVDSKSKLFDKPGRKLNENKKTENEDIIRMINETIEIPRVNGLKEIAGLWEVKGILKSLVVLPRSQPQLFINKKLCNSLLLFGPPGTGKTQIVHALAHEARMTLHSISVSNILSPLVGQSEKNLKYLFEYMQHSEEFSIMFIDEIDGLCKKRNDTEQEHSRRIKTELMCQLSRIEDSKNLFLICVTNCPWDLDAAFLRRFQKRVYIPLPNASERNELFKLFLKHCDLDINIDIWQHLIDNTEGYSGSDISYLVQQAVNIPILELQDTKIWKQCRDGFYEPVTKADDFNLQDIKCCELADLPDCSVRARPVETIDFLNCLNKTHKTVSGADINQYEQFLNINN